MPSPCTQRFIGMASHGVQVMYKKLNLLLVILITCAVIMSFLILLTPHQTQAWINSWIESGKTTISEKPQENNPKSEVQILGPAKP
jgi:cell division protein FtsL